MTAIDWIETRAGQVGALQKKRIWIIVDDKLIPGNTILGCIKESVICKASEVIVPLQSVLVSAWSSVQFGMLHFKENSPISKSLEESKKKYSEN